MPSFPHARTRSRTRHGQSHPQWCNTARCLSDLNHRHEHRSDPLPVGPLVLTMTQRVTNTTPRLEVRYRVPLRTVRGDQGTTHALRLVFETLSAIEVARDDHHGQNGTSARTHHVNGEV